MPWVDELSDLHDLRKCIRDLIALSSLPAIWRQYGPQQIADSLAAALLSLLDADFVQVTLTDGGGDPAIEITCASSGMTTATIIAAERLLRDAGTRRREQALSIVGPGGEGELAVVVVPIDLSGDSMFAAGSLRPGFPSQKERLLLGIAANDATIASNRWQAETDARRLVAIIERSSEFIGFAGMDCTTHYLNPAARNLVGVARGDAISDFRIFDFVAEHDRERAREMVLPVVLNSGRWLGELDFCHLGTGEVIPFLVDWFRIDDRRTGRPMSLATACRDLRDQKKQETELRQMKEALERRVAERTTELRREIAERERADARARALQQELLHASRLSVAGQMVGAIAHEINQPLTALTNSVNAVRRMMANGTGDIDATREIMDEAAALALRAGRIIGRLREFVTHGGIEMRVERLSILIQDAVVFALAGSATVQSRIQFRFDPGAESVLADRVQVQQLLVNLLRNANEAMADAGPQELEISTRLLDHDMVEVAVADRGPGLPGQIANHLFEAFQSTKSDGMGLGLTICRSIAEAHGGDLVYEPNPGGGAIFRFTLPAVSNHEPSGGENHPDRR